jgi:GT2 family glycosyltransferase
MGAKTGVVVVNYAAEALIEANLGGLSGKELVVVVVDNFSTGTSRTAVRALAEERGWTCVPNQNHGFGDGANVGVASAIQQGCDVIVLANPDLELDEARVRSLATSARAEPWSIVAPLVMGTDGLPWGRLGRIDIEHGGLRPAGDRIDSPRWVSGACMAISVQAWVRLGGFSDDYFMYWEDVDLSLRCQRAGGSVRLLDEVRAIHSVGGSQGEGRSRLYYYYNCRNRLVFAAKNLTPGQQVRWLLRTPEDVRRVARRDPSLSRRQRVTKALPPCLRGAAAGSGWMLVSALRRILGRP